MDGVSSMGELLGEGAVAAVEAGGEEEEVVRRAASRLLRLLASLSVEVDLSLALSLLVCGRYRVRT